MEQERGKTRPYPPRPPSRRLFIYGGVTVLIVGFLLLDVLVGTLAIEDLPVLLLGLFGFFLLLELVAKLFK